MTPNTPTRAGSDSEALRAELIAAGVLRPGIEPDGATYATFYNVAREPVLRLDDRARREVAAEIANPRRAPSAYFNSVPFPDAPDITIERFSPSALRRGPGSRSLDRRAA